MAEFGLAAGVLQVAGFGAELGGALWKCAKDIRNAGKDLENLSREVVSTAAALNSVGGLLASADTKTLHTSQLLDDTRKVLDGCRDVFDELDKASKQYLDDSNPSAKVFIKFSSRFRWPLGKSRLLELQGIPERYKSVLSLMLQLLQIVEGRRAATSTELQALETRLEDLVVSNRDLSESNKPLSDAMVSLLQQGNKQKPAAPHISTHRRVTLPDSGRRLARPKEAVNTQQSGVVRDITQSSTASDHLQRCLGAVHDLASSISSALNKLEGIGPEAPLDIARSFSAVEVHINSLRDTVKCSACSATATLSTLPISHVCAKQESHGTSHGQHATTWHFVEASGQVVPDADLFSHPSSMELQDHVPCPDISMAGISMSSYASSQSSNWQQQTGPNSHRQPLSSPSTFGPSPKDLSWTSSAGLGIQYTTASAQPAPPATSNIPPDVSFSYQGEGICGNFSPPELRQPQPRRPYISIATNPVGLARCRRNEDPESRSRALALRRARQAREERRRQPPKLSASGNSDMVSVTLDDGPAFSAFDMEDEQPLTSSTYTPPKQIMRQQDLSNPILYESKEPPVSVEDIGAYQSAIGFAGLSFNFQQARDESSEDEVAHPSKRRKTSDNQDGREFDQRNYADESSTRNAMQELLHRWFAVDASTILG